MADDPINELVDVIDLPPLPEPAYYDRVTARMSGAGIGYTAEQVRQVQREAYEAGRIEGNRAREITEILCNPQWGEPDLYARLNRALSGEYALAQKYGRADVWPAAAHGLIDYLTGAVAALKSAETRMDTGFEGGAQAPIAPQQATPQLPKENR